MKPRYVNPQSDQSAPAPHAENGRPMTYAEQLEREWAAAIYKNMRARRRRAFDDRHDDDECPPHQWWWNNGEPACVKCGAPAPDSVRGDERASDEDHDGH